MKIPPWVYRKVVPEISGKFRRKRDERCGDIRGSEI